MIRTGQLKEDMDKKEMSRLLREKGWSTDDARSVVTVDPTGNMLSDETKGVQFIQESMDSIKSGFEDVIHSGPIAQESVRGLRFILHHFVPHDKRRRRSLSNRCKAKRKGAVCKYLYG